MVEKRRVSKLTLLPTYLCLIYIPKIALWGLMISRLLWFSHFHDMLFIALHHQMGTLGWPIAVIWPNAVIVT